ncbi:hypothetical protein [Mycolicibacterium hippocampi]|uniref:hypothetical protein n=1 Tax=Mycolicibacterium hippocampi TaxID=659824 RepID=UPI0035162604
MNAAEEVEFWRLRRELADLLGDYPVDTWPSPLLAAVVGAINLYAAGQPKEQPVPATVLNLVRSEVRPSS